MDRVTRETDVAGNPAWPIGGDTYERTRDERVVYILTQAELHVGPGNPRAFATFAGAIDWARLDAGFDDWRDMRWHEVEAPSGYRAKFQSDFTCRASRPKDSFYFEIFEVDLE